MLCGICDASYRCTKKILIFVNLFRLHSYYNGSSISESHKRYIQSQVLTFMIMKQNVIYTRVMLFSSRSMHNDVT